MRRVKVLVQTLHLPGLVKRSEKLMVFVMMMVSISIVWKIMELVAKYNVRLEPLVDVKEEFGNKIHGHLNLAL